MAEEVIVCFLISSDLIIKMEMDIKRNCDLCLKDFTDHNEENINRHVKACTKKKLVKSNKNKVSISEEERCNI